MLTINNSAPRSSDYSDSNTDIPRYEEKGKLIKIGDDRFTLNEAYDKCNSMGIPGRLDILRKNLERHFLNFTTDKETGEHTNKDLVRWYTDMAKGLSIEQREGLNKDLEKLLKSSMSGDVDQNTVADIKRVFSNVCGLKMFFKVCRPVMVSNVDAPMAHVTSLRGKTYVVRGHTMREIREQVAAGENVNTNLIRIIHQGKIVLDQFPISSNKDGRFHFVILSKPDVEQKVDKPEDQKKAKDSSCIVF